MMAKEGKVCAVFYCQNYSWQKNAVSFFRFPRDKDTCSQWVNKCQRADLDELFKIHGANKLNSSHRICAKHFKTSDFRNPNLTSQGLKKNVVPSLFLSLPDEVEAQTRRSAKKRVRKTDNMEGRSEMLEQVQGSNEHAEQPKWSQLAVSLQIKILTAKLRNSKNLISKQKQLIRALRQENRALHRQLKFIYL